MPRIRTRSPPSLASSSFAASHKETRFERCKSLNLARLMHHSYTTPCSTPPDATVIIYRRPDARAMRFFTVDSLELDQTSALASQHAAVSTEQESLFGGQELTEIIKSVRLRKLKYRTSEQEFAAAQYSKELAIRHRTP